MATVLTLAQWNALITQMNKTGCPKNPGVLLTDPHLWSTTDITNFQLNLKTQCALNTFTTPAGPLWQQKIIDEINAALKMGCCQYISCTFHNDISLTFQGCENNGPNTDSETAAYVAQAKALTNYGIPAGNYLMQYFYAMNAYCTDQLNLANAQAALLTATPAAIATATANVAKYTAQSATDLATATAAYGACNTAAAGFNAAINAITYPVGTYNLLRYVPKTPWPSYACWGGQFQVSPPVCNFSSWEIGSVGIFGFQSFVSGVFSPDGTPFCNSGTLMSVGGWTPAYPAQYLTTLPLIMPTSSCAVYYGVGTDPSTIASDPACPTGIGNPTCGAPYTQVYRIQVVGAFQ